MRNITTGSKVSHKQLSPVTGLTGTVTRVASAKVLGKEVTLAEVRWKGSNAMVPMQWRCEDTTFAGYKLSELQLEGNTK